MNIFERFLKVNFPGSLKASLQNSVSAENFSDTILKSDCSQGLMGKALLPEQQSTRFEFVVHDETKQTRNVYIPDKELSLKLLEEFIEILKK